MHAKNPSLLLPVPHPRPNCPHLRLAQCSLHWNTVPLAKSWLPLMEDGSPSALSCWSRPMLHFPLRNGECWMSHTMPAVVTTTGGCIVQLPKYSLMGLSVQVFTNLGFPSAPRPYNSKDILAQCHATPLKHLQSTNMGMGPHLLEIILHPSNTILKSEYQCQELAGKIALNCRFCPIKDPCTKHGSNKNNGAASHGTWNWFRWRNILWIASIIL